METAKQELLCSQCGCNHMYVDTYRIPMRTDVLPMTLEDAEFSDHGREVPMLTTLFVLILLCATIAFVAWLIWG